MVSMGGFTYHKPFSVGRWDWMFRKAAKSGQVDLMQLVVCALSSYSNALHCGVSKLTSLHRIIR